MAEIILFLLVVLLIFITIMMLDYSETISVILLVINIFLLGWWIAYWFQPWQTKEKFILHPTCINNVQVIAFLDTNNNPVVINLNEKYKRIIDDKKESVRVIIYKKGPYLGLYYSGGPSSEPYGLEIIKTQ
jgi:uncharacterized membrane protein YraQ (UPF0718 family)